MSLAGFLEGCPEQIPKGYARELMRAYASEAVEEFIKLLKEECDTRQKKAEHELAGIPGWYSGEPRHITIRRDLAASDRWGWVSAFMLISETYRRWLEADGDTAKEPSPWDT